MAPLNLFKNEMGCKPFKIFLKIKAYTTQTALMRFLIFLK